MSVMCEPCAGLGYHASFLCGPADDDAPLTGEMSCDISRAVCSACSGFGRLTASRQQQRTSSLRTEAMRQSSDNALIRARRAWELGRRP